MTDPKGAEIARLTGLLAIRDAEVDTLDAEVSRLTRENEALRAERDAIAAAAYEAAADCRFGWWLGFGADGEPDGTYCSVDPGDGSEYYVCAKAIRALTPAAATAALNRVRAGEWARIRSMIASFPVEADGPADAIERCRWMRDAILARADAVERGE